MVTGVGPYSIQESTDLEGFNEIGFGEDQMVITELKNQNRAFYKVEPK